MLNLSLPSYDNAILIGLGATLAAISAHALVMRMRRQQRADDPRICLLCRATHLVMLLAVLGLASTAFYSVLAYGHLAHWLLLAHVLIGGGFVALLAVVALMFAPVCRRGDRRLNALAKASFLLLLVLGTVSGGSMLLSMLPVFGTEGLEQLLDLHRWSGLCLAVVALAHAYFTLVGRRVKVTAEF